MCRGIQNLRPVGRHPDPGMNFGIHPRLKHALITMTQVKLFSRDLGEQSNGFLCRVSDP